VNQPTVIEYPILDSKSWIERIEVQRDDIWMSWQLEGPSGTKGNYL
jgi:hypothetical protein